MRALVKPTIRSTRKGPGGYPARLFSLAGPAVVGLWGLLVLGAHLWGRHLHAEGRALWLGTPPLFAAFDPRLSLRILLALAVAVAVVLWGPRLAARLSWRRLLVWSMLAALLWAAALAFADGPSALVRPLLSRFDYLHALPLRSSPAEALSSFTMELARYPIHVQGHPPGLILALHFLGRIGLARPEVVAGMMIAAGAMTVPAALVAVREVAGEDRARDSALFLALAPAAIWIATSADALFAGVSAWAVALVVVATGRRDAKGDALALAGGVLFGAALLLSYGVALLAALPLVVAVARRRVRPLLVAAVGALAVLGAFAAAGFWWLDGLGATRLRYLAGVGGRRPYSYFLIGNLAAFGLCVGPAAAVGLSRLRDRGVWLLAGGALAVVAAADLSGLSKGEVERIWLPFVPWVLIGTCALGAAKARRAWLALQAAVALSLQILVVSPW